MNLPNYFIADLPPEAELNATIVKQACETIRRNRDQYLAGRSTQSLIKLLENVALSWLEPDYRFRKLALEHGPAATGFSSATLAHGFETFFKQVTTANLEALLEQDFGDVRRLDRMAASSPEDKTGRAAVATAPQLLAHITSSGLPCPAWQSMLLGLLLRSAQFIKCATGASLLPRLFAHSLYDADSKLGACIEIVEWRGGHAALEQVLFEEADCLTATGSDETLAAIRQRLPLRTRFAGYGHRVSFAFISGGVLSGLHAEKVVARAAEDVVAWDQLGCLSPHAIYIHEGTGMAAEQFAKKLADELAQRELTRPRGQVSVEVAATIAARRAFYELRAANSTRTADTPATRLWSSPGSTAWTVVYESEPLFQLSCLHRFIYVKPVNDLHEMLKAADSVRGKVSTVGLAAPEEKAEDLATHLARWGVTRVCRLGEMQNPPLSWRHDGRPPLGDLIQWTDWEM